jgi:putative transposase
MLLVALNVNCALLNCAVDKGLRNLLIEPGKPWQNGTNESFNGKFRDECLAMNSRVRQFEG